jgi:hypothetical protein
MAMSSAPLLGFVIMDVLEPGTLLRTHLAKAPDTVPRDSANQDELGLACDMIEVHAKSHEVRSNRTIRPWSIPNEERRLGLPYRAW